MADESNTTTFMKEMRERYSRGQERDRDNRSEAMDDLKFRVGDQWPDEIKEAREGRQVLTINQTGQFVRQVTGDIRLNKPTIKVSPAGRKEESRTAEIMTGMIRAIERNSDASFAYQKAADSQVACGMGHWRILTDFIDEQSFDQEIKLQRIKNPFSVVWDPEAVEPNKSDARWCFVERDMADAAFEREYPKAQKVEFSSEQPVADLHDWANKTDKTTKVAEYWVREPVKKTMALLPTGDVVDYTRRKQAEVEQEVLAAGFDPGEIRTREVDVHRVVRYTVSGIEILDGPEPWAGNFIPIISVWGEEVNVGDTDYRHGVIRFMKDPARIFNYNRTASTEAIALSPKAPFILTAKQVEGYEDQWNTANTKNWPYLPYNPEANAPPPQRQAPAIPPIAQIQEAQQAAGDMNAVTGIYPPALGQRSNETSGTAIRARQTESDVGTFVYHDNLARAIRWTGVQLVDLIPKIYDTERTVAILGEDDAEEFEVINKVVDGRVENDLSVGKFEVAVSTGPSFSTRREEARVGMTEAIRAAPQLLDVIADLWVKTFDFPASDEMAERFRKRAVEKGFAEPADDEEPAPPSPEQQAQLAEMAGQVAEIQAQLQKVEAETEGIHLDNAKKALEVTLGSPQFRALIETEIGDILQKFAQSNDTENAPALPGAING